MCIDEVSLSFCIPVYCLQDEDTESESEDECIKNCVAVKKIISSCVSGDNISTYDKGAVLIVTKGISGKHVSLLYLFLFDTSELDCMA